MLVRLVVVLLILGALCRTLSAHTVPTLVVETEFNSARESVIRVNVDPRLFLTAQPTSLPPVAATWWLELGGEAREKAAAATVTYVENTLALRIGDVALLGGWKVVAIDSASAFPLSADSVEVHLL
ncbi:MAG: hypothetical protein WCN98_02595, partial [Verrucomicrobiaceae bacterium]